jgi:hypothetical protein
MKPDYIYYNADIINNTTTDLANGNAVLDPQIRFNETRDTALIKDASEYYFSIVRFTMNGANKDLPLFIPVIYNGTGATNVNLTVYSCAINYKQSFNTTDVGVLNANIVPTPRFVLYSPETRNPLTAPQPKSLASPDFVGLYAGGTVYLPGQIVSQTLDIYGNATAPFYKVAQPQTAWNALQTYAIGAYVSYNGLSYYAFGVPPAGVAPPNAPGSWSVGFSGIVPTTAPYWIGAPANLGSSQDLSTRYYWVYTYQHWVDLVNQTLTDAYVDTYTELNNFWVASGTADPFPFPTFDDFTNYVNTPQMIYDPDTRRFTIYGDSDGFGTRINAFVPTPAPVAPPAVPAAGAPNVRLFFNSNLFGLFTNFPNFYWNVVDGALATGPFGGNPFYPPNGGVIPQGYVNEILFRNKFWSNVADYRLPPYSGVPPLGYVPPNGFTPGLTQQKPYWLATQDYASTDSLWSPVSSIVFTSTLLPVRAEATGQPVVLGQGNIGFSAATSQSAFQPIITDIALDTSQTGSEAYRQFIFYAPSAEYRLSDFTSSRQDIRSIDIQVFWKNRLDNNLYPINMFNLSSVSVKVMFRHKLAHTGDKGGAGY